MNRALCGVLGFLSVALLATTVDTPEAAADTARARAALLQSDYAAAAAAAHEALRATPEKPLPYLLLGLAEHAQGHFAEAAAAYRVVIQLGGEHGRVLRLLSHALRQAGDIHGAVNALAVASVVPHGR